MECGVYPTGYDLIKVAEEVLSLCRISLNEKFENDLVEKFVSSHKEEDFRSEINEVVRGALKNLIESSHTSIDSHIVYVKNEKERNFLKSLILSIILSCTAYSDLKKTFNNNWYPEIAKLIFPTLSKDASNEDRLNGIEKKLTKLQIVTFNYDVSLEMYLLDRLQDFFGKESIDPKAQNGPYSKIALGKIMEKIYHVYGQIYDCDEVFSVYQIRNYVFKDGENFGEQFERQNKSSDFLWRSELTDLCRYNYGIIAANSWNNLMEGSFSHQKHIFYYLVLKYALLINSRESRPKIGDKELTHERIKVIKEDERSSEIEEELMEKISNGGVNWDLVYILGYGFDQDNNGLLGFDKIRNYKRGCFVTNYAKNKDEVNQRLQRLILDELSSIKAERRGLGDILVPSDQFIIPYISHKSVSQALKEDFSLLENPNSPLVIQTNLTPYLELKK